MKTSAAIYLLSLAILTSISSKADIITLNFEGLPDGTPIGNTYAAQGALFMNATAITAGLSLNEFEFPPRSGENVATDSGGPIDISFSALISSFSAYFTYTTPVDIIAFNSADQQVGQAISLFSANYVSSGNPPNELIQVAFASGIDHIVITGNPTGGSFVMDDVTFNNSVSASPEPGTLISLGIGLFTVGMFRRRNMRSARQRL